MASKATVLSICDLTGNMVRPWLLPSEASIVFAFPDCTYLTISGNRWQRARGPGCIGRGLMFADACWRLAIAYGCPWMMENPAVGRLSTAWCKPDFTFHPWEYAGYLPDVQTEPHRHDCFEAPPSPDRADVRSVTPMGFAVAVFEANGVKRESEAA